MKKLMTILFVVMLFTGVISAQDKSLGVGLNVALPMGNFGDFAGTGFGGTVVFEMEFSPQLNGTATAGYITWGGKDFGSFSYTYSAIPILVGAKYFFMPTGGFYGHGQIGFYLFSVDVESPSGNSFFTGSSSSTEFTISLGAGYEIPINENLMADIGAAYIIISDLGHVGIRAGVIFGL